MRITIIGPRSVGKSTTSKLFAKKLNLDYISSDDCMDLRLKKIGGLKGAFDEKNKDFLFKEATKFLQEIFLRDNFVLDIAGGATSTTNSKGERMDLSIVKNNSIIIGLLPFKDDSKSIEFLFQREKNRKHWKETDLDILYDKTIKHYISVKDALNEKLKYIIYVGDKTSEEIIRDINIIIKNENSIN